LNFFKEFSRLSFCSVVKVLYLQSLLFTGFVLFLCCCCIAATCIYYHFQFLMSIPFFIFFWFFKSCFNFSYILWNINYSLQVLCFKTLSNTYMSLPIFITLRLLLIFFLVHNVFYSHHYSTLYHYPLYQLFLLLLLDNQLLILNLLYTPHLYLNFPLAFHA